MESHEIIGDLFIQNFRNEIAGFRYKGLLYTPPFEPNRWARGVRNILGVGAIPASIDHLIELRAHLQGKDHSLNYLFSGTLRLQTGSKNERRVSFGELSLEDWQELAKYLHNDQNFVDLSRTNKDQNKVIGRLERVLTRGKHAVPENDLAFSTANTTYESDPRVTAIMPTKAGLNRRIIHETNSEWSAFVSYSRADLASKVVQVGPVGLNGRDFYGIGSVNAGDDFPNYSVARGEAPPSAKKK